MKRVKMYRHRWARRVVPVMCKREGGQYVMTCDVEGHGLQTDRWMTVSAKEAYRLARQGYWCMFGKFIIHYTNVKYESREPVVYRDCEVRVTPVAEA